MCSKPFEPRLQLDEDAEVGELGDLALDDVAGLVLAGDVGLPRVVLELLEAQRDPLAVLVDLQDLALDRLASLRASRWGGRSCGSRTCR